jgi:hypothetical protein
VVNAPCAAAGFTRYTRQDPIFKDAGLWEKPKVSATATHCSHYSANKIDYADANVSVVPGASEQVCCDACAAHNAKRAAIGDTDPATNCTIVVWLNTPPLSCAMKATANKPFQSVRVAALQPQPGPPGPAPISVFRFSNIYGSGMVLQAAPARANVWGFCKPNESSVSVSFNGQTLQAAVKPPAGPGKPWTWGALLPATAPSFTPFNVTATAGSDGSIQTLVRIRAGCCHHTYLVHCVH